MWIFLTQVLVQVLHLLDQAPVLGQLENLLLHASSCLVVYCMVKVYSVVVAVVAAVVAAFQAKSFYLELQAVDYQVKADLWLAFYMLKFVHEVDAAELD